MRRLRWRLARLIAPAPILPDPYPGEEGVFVMIREQGYEIAFRSERFRLKSTRRVAQLDYGLSPIEDFRPEIKSFTRFVGTIAS